MKKLFPIVLISIIVLLFIFFLRQNSKQTTQTKASASGADVYLQSDQQTVTQNQPITVNLIIDAGDLSISAINYRLEFDKNAFRAIEVKKADSLPVELALESCPQPIGDGFICGISGTSPTQIPTGIFTVVNATFTALKDNPGCITISPQSQAAAIGQAGNVISQIRNICFPQGDNNSVDDQNSITCVNADINADGTTNALDAGGLIFLLSKNDIRADINADGDANREDLSSLVGCF